MPTLQYPYLPNPKSFKQFNVKDIKTQPDTKSSFKHQPSNISLNQNKVQNSPPVHQQDHSLLYEILQRNKRKTIQHQVNMVNPQSTVLYKKHNNQNHQQPDIKNLLEQSKGIQTRYDKKLNKLYSKIKSQFNNLQKFNRKSQNLKDNTALKKSLSLKSNSNKNHVNEQNVQKIQHTKSQIFSGRKRNRVQRSKSMINASGVVSYKFKSLLAQKSLVYNRLNNKSREQLLSCSLQSIKQRSNNYINRENKISYRSVGSKDKQTRQKQIAFKQGVINKEDKQLSIDKYLQRVMREKRNIERVYGEQESKLSHIRYLMNQLGFEREVSQFSIDDIVQKVKTQLHSNNRNQQTGQSTQNSVLDKRNNSVLPIRKSTIERDQRQLNLRRKVCYKPKRNKTLYQLNNNNKQISNVNRSPVILTNLNFIPQY